MVYVVALNRNPMVFVQLGTIEVSGTALNSLEWTELVSLVIGAANSLKAFTEGFDFTSLVPENEGLFVLTVIVLAGSMLTRSRFIVFLSIDLGLPYLNLKF